MPNILFGDRFDFLGLGPASTNQSAVVLACALVSCGWFWLQPKRRWQVLGLVFGAVLAVLLVATKSRGGLIATACGLGVLAAVTRPRFSRWVWLSVLVVGGVVIAYGTVRGVWGRFTYGDDSRSGLWRAGLAMLWDFPQGVGPGNTPATFTDWYQEVGDRRGYLSLINFHLTWLAERGLGARVAYALAWAGLAWVVWPWGTARPAVTPYLGPRIVTTIAAGVWTVFFVSAVFSTTATAWQLWVIPLGWLGGVLVWGWRAHDWSSRRVAAGLAVCALGALAVLHLAGRHLSDPRLAADGRHEVRFGEGEPRIVIYEPNAGVLGSQWGHDIRGQSGAVSVRSREIPPQTSEAGRIWILSGTYPAALPPKVDLKIFNMVATAEFLGWLEKQAPASIDVTLSESLYRDLHGDDWFTWSDKHPANVRVVGGAGLYVPNWMPE